MGGEMVMNVWGKAISCVGLMVMIAGGGASTTNAADGLSVGVFGTYVASDITFAETPVMPMGPVVTERGSGNIDGFGGGFSVGYDQHVSERFVIGVVADIAAGDWNVAYNFGPTLTGTYQVQSIGTIRGRFGYEAVPGMMFYATAGYAFANLKHSGAVAPVFIRYSPDGWVAGLGGEIDMGAGASLYAEYLHIEFSDGDFVLHNDRHDVELGSDMVRFGVKISLY